MEARWFLCELRTESSYAMHIKFIFVGSTVFYDDSIAVNCYWTPAPRHDNPTFTYLSGGSVAV